MSGRPASTRARAASTSSCRPATRSKVPDGYIAMPSRHLSRLRAAALDPQERQRRRRRQGRRLRASGSSSIRSRRRPTRRRRSFVDAIDVVFDTTIPYDLRFFQSLDRIVQAEPWLERDRAMIDPLKIDRHREGQAVQPRRRDTADPRGRRHARRTPGSTPSYEDALAAVTTRAGTGLLPMPEAVRRACRPSSPDAGRLSGRRARHLTYTCAFFSAKHLGAGQFYLMTITDKDGKPSTASTTYRLTVPANAPVNAVLVGNGLRPRDPRAHPRHARASRSSTASGLQKNADGSVDIYFGPRRRRARSRTGCRPSAERELRGAVPLLRPARSRCSTRPGSCRTSQPLETQGARR